MRNSGAALSETIWILVPVYNVEKLLDKCVQSILRQTYENWKLVLVDDGSTDQSGRMCDEYAKKDSRIQVVHTPNGGLPVARINGVKQIDDTGYCCFCDSDDEMPENALQLLYDEAKRTNADMVCGSIQRICRGIKVPTRQKFRSFSNPRIYEKQEILSNLYLCCFGGGSFPVNLVAKLYKSKMIKSVMLNTVQRPHYFAEDLNVTIHLFPEIDDLSVINDTVYYYRIGGGTSRFMPTFLEDNILMYNIKMDMAHHCTSERDVRRLVGIELKNIIVTYWVMCEKSGKYPHGDLLEEIKSVCAMDEVKEALTMLEGDRSGLAGINEPLITRDYDKICELIRKKVKKDIPRDLVKKILMG